MTYSVADHPTRDRNQYFSGTHCLVNKGGKAVDAIIDEVGETHARVKIKGKAVMVKLEDIQWSGNARPRLLRDGASLLFIGPAGRRSVKKGTVNGNCAQITFTSTGDVQRTGVARNAPVMLLTQEPVTSKDEALTLLRAGMAVTFSDTAGILPIDLWEGGDKHLIVYDGVLLEGPAPADLEAYIKEEIANAIRD